MQKGLIFKESSQKKAGSNISLMTFSLLFSPLPLLQYLFRNRIRLKLPYQTHLLDQQGPFQTNDPVVIPQRCLIHHLTPRSTNRVGLFCSRHHQPDNTFTERWLEELVRVVHRSCECTPNSVLFPFLFRQTECAWFCPGGDPLTVCRLDGIKW